ncbi:MAG: heavy-metal-associated domain-containing protein [Polaromonas sp.]
MTHFFQEKTIISFQVKDMTCGHCVNHITKAVMAVDQDARVGIDLAVHRIDIETAAVDAARLAQIITDAGYTPAAVEAAPAAPAARRGACC